MPSRDVLLLAVGQGLTATIVALLTAILALAGELLAPARALATLPVSTGVLGTMLAIYPAAMLMRRTGRRAGFMLKAGLGATGAAVSCLGLALSLFPLLLGGAFLFGAFSAFGQYYRFAAIDAAESPQTRTTAVAWVTLGGVVGGLTGPWLAGRFAPAIPSLPYAGGFIAIVVLCLLLAVSQCFISIDLGREMSPDELGQYGSGKSFDAGFYRVGVICAVGFASMTLTMNAAPLTLHDCGYGIASAATVLQAHFVSMYLPSLFFPWLAGRLTLRGVIACGLAVNAAGSLLTMWPTQSYELFVFELALSGIAWNFVFNGGTLLLGETYSAVNKDRAQGFNSLLVYGGNIIASFSAGWLVNSFGWSTANLMELPLIALAAACLVKRGSLCKMDNNPSNVKSKLNKPLN
ncbi:MFS transporter [Paraburkholderia humisilvae]|uniref:Riboflavin transporter RfnT n=2 Tax=Paraburkholderia humisilvae TaxID=627669 RepID=A0A6J5FB40_9BURK|nr:MFS transporter [Paraburkholderia humisilvae]CAB3775021.1 Riboflavin transporter RfnT [Paraburkholderia humisilvae]